MSRKPSGNRFAEKTFRKEVRRSQSLSPFGVGAIYDLQGESIVTADIRFWKSGVEKIQEPRLQKTLGVEWFGVAAEAPQDKREDTGPGIPYVRFPRWLFCSRCRQMVFWTDRHDWQNGAPAATPVCRNPDCRGHKLSPMRFVMACPRGHLEDVPWHIWAHSVPWKPGIELCADPAGRLRFETHGGGSGLESVTIKCGSCGRRRSLESITAPGTMKALGVWCSGLQPWEDARSGERCDAVPHVLQRGASALWFAKVESSIDIPPWSDPDYFDDAALNVRSDEGYGFLMNGAVKPDYIVDMVIQDIVLKQQRSEEVVRRIVLGDLKRGRVTKPDETGLPADRNQLLEQEFQALTAPDPGDEMAGDRFRKADVDLYVTGDGTGSVMGPLKQEAAGMLGQLVQVTRLREVRVLSGFSRLGPAEGMKEDEGEGPGRFEVYGSDKRIAPAAVSPSLGNATRWLPGIEVYGEGVFLTLPELALKAWEARPDVQARSAIITGRAGDSTFLGSQNPNPDARTLLLHTLSHLLIRELSFDCGYSLASLRERVYSSTSVTYPMGGILLYTAAGDAEGTLGGLVRQGERDRFLSNLIRAIRNAEWCSSDPLCHESQGQGLGNLNLAACHACALLPETSCTMGNRLLDRVLVTGEAGNRGIGFFGDLLERTTALVFERGGSEA